MKHDVSFRLRHCHCINLPFHETRMLTFPCLLFRSLARCCFDGISCLHRKLVQPVIPARTCEKVKVQSSSKKSLQMCLDAIDPSVLPKDFGGDYSGQWMMK